jgi:hypothetical protein
MNPDFKLSRRGIAHYMFLIIIIFFFYVFFYYSYILLIEKKFDFESLLGWLFLGYMTSALFAYFRAEKIFVKQGVFTFRHFAWRKHKYGFPIIIKKIIRDTEIEYIKIASAEHFQKEGKKFISEPLSEDLEQTDLSNSFEMNLFKKFTFNKIKVDSPYFIYVKSKNSSRYDIFFYTKDLYSKRNLKNFQSFLNSIGVRNEFLE